MNASSYSETSSETTQRIHQRLAPAAPGVSTSSFQERSEQQTVQNAPTLSDTSPTSDTLKDTLDAPREQPTPPQDTQAVRSFSSKGEEKKEPEAKVWDELTEAERQPFTSQAEKELRALFGESGWGGLQTKARHMDSRASNLYAASLKEAGR